MSQQSILLCHSKAPTAPVTAWLRSCVRRSYSVGYLVLFAAAMMSAI